MKLPNGDRAVVPPAKLTAYLLSDTYTFGRSKAHVFRSVGFTPASADRLAQELLLFARSEENVAQVDSPHGTKYVVDGTLATPRGDLLRLRTVWIIDPGHDAPRFVTAYPR